MQCFQNVCLPKGAPCVELTLQALNIGQEVNNVHVRVVLLGGKASCREQQRTQISTQVVVQRS